MRNKRRTNMKVKLDQMLNSVEALAELTSTKLPSKPAYRVARITNKIEAELKLFNEQRSKIVLELGTPSEENEDQFTFTPENSIKFNEQISDLLNEEVEIDVPTISINELGSAEIKPATMMILDWMLVD